MSESVSQTQKAGDESTNVQAGSVVIHQHALSYSDVKEIALDVFRSNFEVLSRVAKETARARAEEITEGFLKELRERNPAGLEKAETPQFQLNLLTLQKEYVRTGDKDLGKLLVDLLIDVTKQEGRTVLQIVLEECMTVAPKLTVQQVAALAIIFLFRYAMDPSVHTSEVFVEYCKFALPFLEHLEKKETVYRHLEYSGCGSISLGSMTFEAALSNTYTVLFSRPFAPEELKHAVPELSGSDLIIPSSPEGTLQFALVNEASLAEAIGAAGLGDSVTTKAKNFLVGRRLPHDQVKSKAEEWAPELKQVFDIWDGSSMKSFNLTSVGLGIAHAAVRSRTGFNAGLSTWVN